jgi:hypothetical protein
MPVSLELDGVIDARFHCEEMTCPAHDNNRPNSSRETRRRY